MNKFVEAGEMLRPTKKMPLAARMHQKPDDQKHGNLDLTFAEAADLQTLMQMQLLEKGCPQIFTANASNSMVLQRFNVDLLIFALMNNGVLFYKLAGKLLRQLFNFWLRLDERRLPLNDGLDALGQLLVFVFRRCGLVSFVYCADKPASGR